MIFKSFASCLSLLVLLTVCSGTGFAQISQPVSAPPVSEMVEKAAAKRTEYITQFKDLLSRETKTFEVFDKDGSVKKRKTIVSNFLVYSLEKRKDAVTEFRSVLSVDGKTVNDADKRTQDLYNDVAKASSSESELSKIEREGSRFDEGISVDGLTLFEAPILSDNMRSCFDVTPGGTEMLDGKQTYVVDYKQKGDCPYVSLEPKFAPPDGTSALVFDLGIGSTKKAMPRVSGRLWLDAETYRVRREVRELYVRPEKDSAPVLAQRFDLAYNESRFDILTPSKLVFTNFATGKKNAAPRKDTVITFDYSPFARPETGVKVIEN